MLFDGGNQILQEKSPNVGNRTHDLSALLVTVGRYEFATPERGGYQNLSFSAKKCAKGRVEYLSKKSSGHTGSKVYCSRDGFCKQISELFGDKYFSPKNARRIPLKIKQNFNRRLATDFSENQTSGLSAKHSSRREKEIPLIRKNSQKCEKRVPSNVIPRRQRGVQKDKITDKKVLEQMHAIEALTTTNV